MSANGKTFVLAALCAATAACADRVAVDIRCVPRGAEVLEGAKSLGTCPTTVYYDVAEEDKKRGTVRVPALTARWASGANAAIEPMSFDLAKKEHTRRVSVARPAGHPGAEVDAKRARELDEADEKRKMWESMRGGGNGGGGGGGGY